LLIHRGAGVTHYLNSSPPPDEAQDDSFAIYNVDGTLIRELPAFAGYFSNGTEYGDETPVACSPDASTCALAANQGVWMSGAGPQQTTGVGILLWRLDGTLIQAILQDVPVFTVAFSPDGSRLTVTTNGVARVYSVADGSKLAERKYTNGVF
jgi:hypothetical protein